MADAKEFVQSMKSAAVEAVKATKPVNVYFGEVQSTAPLKINVEQKMLLGEGQLILTRNVTDFDIMVTMNWESQSHNIIHKHTGVNGDTENQSVPHTHVIAGQKQITIHNGLDVGDSVILIRQQEGQKFIVLDRIGGKL